MYDQEFCPAYPGGKVKAFTLSYDDGVDSDIRLVEMMRRYGVRGTFNLNSLVCPQEPDTDPNYSWHKLTMQQCVELYGDDMEIALHGARHCHWNHLPTPQAIAEILDDRRNLEKLTGKPVLGAVCPYGSYNDDVMRILELAGIEYCRIGKGTEKIKLENPDWLRFSGTCLHKNPKLMEYATAFVDAQVDYQSTYLLYVFGHSYEFVLKDNWYVMEDLLKTVGGHEDVWYATNIEIVEYLKAAQQLIFDVEGNLLRNPTDVDIWVQLFKEKQILRVPAGGTVRFS